MVTGRLLAKDGGHVYLLAWAPGYGWLFILFNVKKTKKQYAQVCQCDWTCCNNTVKMQQLSHIEQ